MAISIFLEKVSVKDLDKYLSDIESYYDDKQLSTKLCFYKEWSLLNLLISGSSSTEYNPISPFFGSQERLGEADGNNIFILDTERVRKISSHLSNLDEIWFKKVFTLDNLSNRDIYGFDYPSSLEYGDKYYSQLQFLKAFYHNSVEESKIIWHCLTTIDTIKSMNH